jgi:hypothetical protein
MLPLTACSWARSAALSADSARVNCAVRAVRLLATVSRPAALSASGIRRPSSGSGLRSISPRASSEASVARHRLRADLLELGQRRRTRRPRAALTAERVSCG